jgi:hypothetical protein
MRRRLTLTSTTVLLALLAMLAIGLLAPAAFAVGHRPVVTSVSPNTCTQDGGLTVVVTGKYFKFHGLKVVDSVTFGAKKATKVRVLSDTKLRCTAPAGTGAVYVRVTTFKGKSKRLPAAKFTYVGPATTMTLNAGTNQSASAGTTVPVAPSVIVKDARNRPVPGIAVTFDVASGGGSVTGASATTDAAGIATVGSWKLGGTAGANWLSATSAGLAGSPVAFFAAGDPGILTVKQAGTPVRAYSLAELQALTPFAGFAGIYKATSLGPDAVTGVKVTDIVANALGAPLATAQSVEVTNLAPPAAPYTKTFPYDQLTNPAGSTHFTYYDVTTKAVITPTGTLAAILIYSDPDARVMPADKGPLRFAIADSLSENMGFTPSSDSVGTVNQLNVIPTP